ncbi:MAG: hypothetical protein QE164_00480 [Candidatus Nezhaarchaeota archaeon]|nr:hypothetical protein [Candidatus Nezhaarchaeota archaeon]
MSEYEGKCPRCGSSSANYGLVLITVGMTRKVRASVNVCGRCSLLFYEFKQPQ